MYILLVNQSIHLLIEWCILLFLHFFLSFPLSLSLIISLPFYQSPMLFSQFFLNFTSSPFFQIELSQLFHFLFFREYVLFRSFSVDMEELKELWATVVVDGVRERCKEREDKKRKCISHPKWMWQISHLTECMKRSVGKYLLSETAFTDTFALGCLLW
jgi:hypothetical protein